MLLARRFAFTSCSGHPAVSSFKIHHTLRWNATSAQTSTAEPITLAIPSQTIVTTPVTSAESENMGTNERSTPKEKKSFLDQPGFLIQTLEASKLLRSDFLNLSKWRVVKIDTPDGSSTVLDFMVLRRAVNGELIGSDLRQAFPPDTRGFLYYHAPSDLPITAGEVRFRKTQTDDPKQFAEGEDLQVFKKKRWRFSFAKIALDRQGGFRDLLMSDNLIQPAVMEDYKKKMGADGVVRPVMDRKPSDPRSSIQTLDPSKLLPSDFIDLSTTTQVYTPDSSFRVPHLSRGSSHKPKKYRYPQGTHGFLYYHSPRNLPPTAGELRFRITKTSDPNDFAHGQDLQNQNLLTWSMPLMKIASLHPLHALRKLLTSDQLVTPALMEKCSSMVRSVGSDSRRAWLHALDQPFEVWFDRPFRRLSIIGKDKVEPLAMDNWDTFIDSRIPIGCEERARRPYQGGSLCRFERSTLPVHSSTPTVVMRIMRLLKPPTPIDPTYDGFVPIPKEGELVSYPGGEPWSLVVDERLALHLLMEDTPAS